MIQLRGNYYDGKSSTSTEVLVSVSEDGEMLFEGISLDGINFQEIRVSPRIGSTARFLEFPSGARLETRDHEQIDELARRWPKKDHGILYTLETNSTTIVAAVIAMVFVLFVTVRYGIPALSGSVTAMLPTSLDDQLGGPVLEQLDDIVFASTTLPEPRQEELRDLFINLAPQDRDYRLEFRSSEIIGPNALALPNAQVVFTDQLIELTDDNEMLMAIMLHEIGHVVERHAMQAVIGQAGLSMLIVGLTGDIGTASTTLIVMLPTFYMQSAYTRDLEWEADTYALNEMLRLGIDTNKFADMMERIMESAGIELEENPEDASSMSQYFQTHPPTELRIDRFRNPEAHQ